MIKTYQNIGSIKLGKSIKSWLFQIANHAVIDFYRRNGTREALNIADLWHGEEELDAEQSLSQCVAPFIKALPEESAELLTEIDLKGKSQKAYAAALGVSYSTLKSRVQKGRGQLRSLFEECCHLTLDKQGNIVDCEAKSSGSCKTC